MGWYVPDLKSSYLFLKKNSRKLELSFFNYLFAAQIYGLNKSWT